MSMYEAVGADVRITTDDPIASAAGIIAANAGVPITVAKPGEAAPEAEGMTNTTKYMLVGGGLFAVWFLFMRKGK